MYYFQAGNGYYLSFTKIPAWLSVICCAKFAVPLYVYMHTDHSGRFDNKNARSKFPSHSSTLMKNPIMLGVSHFSGGNVFGGSWWKRVYFYFPFKMKF